MADFLGALGDNERSAFTAVGRRRRFARGEVIFHEGDDPGAVVAVVSGTVKISLIGAAGREVVLRFSGPGELVGELAACICCASWAGSRHAGARSRS
jgi:CRP/FNR family cyclic AMP-dependent transcriptional regulator